ncbi:hypothetical protein DID88_008630 [Monilinia fructigena]|uniref:Uncharacterized protein n=1 Tax=Monilinia fructigena TaxID=38457 RepID=A0A395J5X1_9HELO|nr:hypothetical protein DID88_008630 [Monilinia fructigena]
MTLYYSLVFVLLVAEMAFSCFSSFLFLSQFAKDVYFHKRKSTGSKITIWDEDYVHLHPDPSQAGNPVLGHERMEVQARKFYSQRNIPSFGRKGQPLRGNGKTGGKDSEKLERAGNAGEIGKLKNLLAQKERDIETLKEQSARNKQFSDDILDKAQANEPSAGSRKEK